jgi:polysaccharide chain length determinant protein (PEP-CTERM system associated)
METASITHEFNKYWQLCLKKKHLIILTALAIVTVSVILGILLPKSYEAKSSVLIERNVITNYMQGIVTTPNLDERLRVLHYAIKSKTLLLKVIDEVNFPVNKKNKAELDGLVEALQFSTEIKMTRDNMFTVTYKNRDPALARDYINTLVKTYILDNLLAKKDEAYVANQFLSAQIKEFKQKIDQVDAEIIKIRKATGIYTGVDERDIVSDIKNKQDRVEELDLQKMELLAKKNMIEKQLKSEKPYAVSVLSRGGDDSMSVSNRLIHLQQRLNELMMKYTESYPEVISVRAEISSLRDQLKRQSEAGEDPKGDGAGAETQIGGDQLTTLNPIYQQLKEELARVENEIAGITAKQDRYKKLASVKESNLRNVPLEQKRIGDLERERDSYREIYDKLINRLSQSEVSKNMDAQDRAETFRIVDPATLPTHPVSPNRPMMLITGIFLGLACGVGIVILLDYLDATLKSLSSLKEMGIPILGIIPRIETEEELAIGRVRDRRLYTLSSAYFAGILIIFKLVP